MILIKPVENLPALAARESPFIFPSLWEGTYWVAVLEGREVGGKQAGMGEGGLKEPLLAELEVLEQTLS